MAAGRPSVKYIYRDPTSGATIHMDVEVKLPDQTWADFNLNIMSARYNGYDGFGSPTVTLAPIIFGSTAVGT